MVGEGACSIPLSHTSGRYPLVAQTLSPDLFDHAKDLFVGATWLTQAQWGPVASATSRIKSRRLIKGSGDLLPSSPPTEKSTTSQDQAAMSSRSHKEFIFFFASFR